MPKTSDIVRVPVECSCCGKAKILPLSAAGIQKRAEGGMIQDCFPDLDRGLREMLVSGTCPECWDEMFSEKEDEWPS
jgi:hypothetical protein